MPLRVLVDARPARTGRSGVGTYARGLLAALAELPEPPHLVGFAGRLRRRRPVGAAPPGTWADRGLLRVLLGVAARAGVGLDRFQRVDLAHALDLAPFPIRPSVPLVATIHDAFPWTHPQWFPLHLGARLAARGDRLLEEARRLVAPTQRVANQLVEEVGVDPRRIVVVPHGVTLPAGTTHPPPDVERPYLVALGTIEPRKNLVRLVQAFARSRARQAGLELVVAGAIGWNAEASLGAIASDERVRLVEAPDEARRDELLAGAQGLVQASLDEGFGFPVLEALGRGTPVLVGADTGAHEVGGEVVLAADPSSIDALADGLDALVDAAAAGPGAVAARRARAEAFPWQTAAARTLRIWHEVVEG
ncbi:MAG: glycosyltransferase family 4 protein [Planctomycetota bacterium]